MNLRIEPLTILHDRKSFECSDETVGRFLREKAFQDQRLDLGRTYVQVDRLDKKRIIGYHSIVITEITQEQIPDDRPKIKRNIPVMLLGQLGVATGYQGRGYGERLLLDAQYRAYCVSEIAGIRAVVLDARNERLAAWYSSHGFAALDGSLRMVKLISTIRNELT